jgi:hypothetical protein
MTVPWLLLAAIPLVFALIEAAPLFIPIALIGVGASSAAIQVQVN